MGKESNGPNDTWDAFFRLTYFGPTVALACTCAIVCCLVACAEHKIRASHQRHQRRQEPIRPANMRASQRAEGQAPASSETSRFDDTSRRGSCYSTSSSAASVETRVRVHVARPFWGTTDTALELALRTPAPHELADALGAHWSVLAASGSHEALPTTSSFEIARDARSWNARNAHGAQPLPAGLPPIIHCGPWCGST